MISIRRMFGVLMTAALMALAVTTHAGPPPNKLYSLEMCVGSYVNGVCIAQQTPGAPTQIQARVINQSPSGSSSSISAFDLFTTLLNWSIDSASVVDNSGQANVDISQPGHIRVTNLNPVKPKAFVTVAFTVNAAFSCGDQVWDVTPWSGSSVGSGAKFTPVSGYTKPTSAVACATVGCNTPFTVQPGEGFCEATPNDPDCVSGLRGEFDSDGVANTACTAVDIYVTNTLAIDDLLHLEWQNAPEAAFAYKVNVESGVAPIWQVAWQSNSQGPVLIDAPACQGLSSSVQGTALLPKPYGTLVQGISKTANKIQVTLASGATTPAVGTSIVIGTERMLVTNTNSTYWFVQRGTGGTDAAPHDPNVSVMTTPLPVLAGYTFTSAQALAGYSNGLQAQMCRASDAQNNGDGTWSAWFIDIFDGWVGIR